MLRMSARSPSSVLALWLVVVGPAAAQSPQPAGVAPYVGEIVMSASGQLVTPWKEVKACSGNTEPCTTAVFNTKTREIARFGDRWATRFEATGNGSEVRRAEAALAKAIRLSPDYQAQAPG